MRESPHSIASVSITADQFDPASETKESRVYRFMGATYWELVPTEAGALAPRLKMAQFEYLVRQSRHQGGDRRGEGMSDTVFF